MKLSILLISAVLLMTGCTHQPKQLQTSKQQTRIACGYTCVMHPKICLEKPGFCPVCKMKLVKKE